MNNPESPRNGPGKADQAPGADLRKPAQPPANPPAKVQPPPENSPNPASAHPKPPGVNPPPTANTPPTASLPPAPKTPPANQPGKRLGGSWFFLLAALGLIIGLAASRSPLAQFIKPDKATLDFQTMRTFAVITIPAGSGTSQNPVEVAELAKAAVLQVDELMSPVGENSDIRRFNNSPVNQWVDVHPLTWQVIMESLRWNRLTDGAFDPTVGPIKALFKFDQREVESWPDEKELAEARQKVGAEKIHYDREGMRLYRDIPGMRLDLGAIAKGFAADQAARVLQANGVQNALVNIGGELRILGKKPGHPPTPWRTGIRHPRMDDMEEKLELEDAAVATSGDYENFFIYQGRRYEHIINPQTGLPLSSGPSSVTVIHPNSCLAADALATTLCILGAEKGKAFLEKQAMGLFAQGVRVIMLLSDDPTRESGRRLEFTIDTKGQLTTVETVF